MVYTFPKGGIHPPDTKLAAAESITTLAVPDMVYMPVSQHLGVPAKPIVARGDEVKVGAKIAEASGFVSAFIHAPVSGTVQKIDKMMCASGFYQDVIVIKTNGDVWEETINRTDEVISDISLSAEEIRTKVLENGIVGMGGATFPSHVKFIVPDGKKAEELIINGVECEPYLSSDHRLMLEKAEEIFVGIEIIKKAIGVPVAYVGIEKNKPDAIELFSTIAEKHPTITVIPLEVKYPQGGEKQLIKAVTGKEVPIGGLPIDAGSIVHNVGTVFAVYEAVQKNKPLIERVITVTGKQVLQQSNFLVRIGTPVQQLIDAAGGVPEDTGKVIAGGPMMGKTITSLNAPVTKGTSGILMMPSTESKREEMANCIRCGKCISVCCVGVEPYLLMSLAEHEMVDELQEHAVMQCIECGSCSFSCPAHRPLLDYIRLGKNIVREHTKKKK
ncbi:MAG: electron transport complex subunit RsxC [Bacteroidales bacterium]|jgi:electron transport complex protein RnfC|nr:electron transport complex subunit RsxC [Bacteroidales bacterium]